MNVCDLTLLCSKGQTIRFMSLSSPVMLGKKMLRQLVGRRGCNIMFVEGATLSISVLDFKH